LLSCRPPCPFNPGDWLSIVV